ncbi:hypothetical protein [Bradyrhizobium sp. AUGA SZCCT0431]|uniref:hypothetical protein n=1 Tax=Bradyrhizobium sp. AUGA SZCCT0431 TaxID=2807674 RepID=UPI001BA940F7|nr:hypothetical protein [Bradyrhizobium sp. AUGA SZCCT0431]MBR1147103.1 hypothetical protein [Bradyrhizobium sp. AUGA SZCCT0431]
MQSMQKPKPTDDPHDILVVAPDAVRVAPDPVKVAPAEEEFFGPAPDPVRAPSGPQPHIEPVFRAGAAVPPVDATFRAIEVDEITFRAAAVEDALINSRRRPRSSMARRAMRAVTALLLAGCIGGAAMAWHYHAEAAQRIIAEWAPLFAQKSSQAPEKTGLTAQPVLAAADVDASNTSPAPQAPAAAPAAVEAATAAPAAAAPPATAAPDQPQSLETMARDLASASREIEQLKASVEQLKASQQQLVAMVSEKSAAQNAQAKKPAPPPRPVAAIAPARTPAPPPVQPRPVRQQAMPSAAAAPLSATSAPYVPRQLEAQSPTTAETLSDPELASVPRPPMPLR